MNHSTPGAASRHLRSAFGLLSVVGALALPVSSTFAQVAPAAKPCEPAPARAVSVQGTVEARRVAQPEWQPVKLNDTFCPGDSIRVQERSRADIALLNQSVLRLNANSTITVEAPKEERTGVVDLIRGAAHFFSRGPNSLDVKTPFTIAGVRGTEFFISVEPDKTLLTVFEGTVVAENPDGSLSLTNGQSALAVAGKAPTPTLVARPRDAVHWALYYPPVLYIRPDEFPAGSDWQGMVRTSSESYIKGDLVRAFGSIQSVPADVPDSRFYAYRAHLLLAVGRADDARGDIARALQLAPNDANAASLLTIIAVVQDDKDKALQIAQAAVAANPNSATALIAQSYAQQARFDLEGARASVEKAVQLEPQNALAWARLAELHSSFGDLDKALAAAQKAVALEPNLSRTQTVLGFAYLTQVKTAQAREAFEKAITFDQADPLPRLGLGLSKIRDGKLDEGSRDLEISASLDPNNSIVRSYLGKTYFEEKRSPLDAREYAMAKQLDPKDPTPYFYDAIAKQTANRPGEALQDMTKAIELNDNRAVYRSQLLLDSDAAARSASLARIYTDLGFQQLALLEGWNAVNTDPGNYSAHRFLADSYVVARRQETARVSELLQAQMLQDININPVQPSVSETNLNIVTSGGPAEAGFNEFTPLFERNQVRVNVTGYAGNQNTTGGEGLVSAIYDRFSISAGIFHHQTDGFAPNHDISHDIYNLFAQFAVTPQLNLQAEVGRRRSEEGDLAQNFDPDQFSANKRRVVHQDFARAGLRYSITPESDLLLSYIHSDRKESDSDQFDIGPDLTAVTEGLAHDKGYQAEGQYLYRMHRLNITAGFGHTDVDSRNRAFATIGGEPVIDFTSAAPVRHTYGYVYGNIRFPDNVMWTLGVSHDDLDDVEIQVRKTNPKFGVQWNLTDNLRLRAAVFRMVTPLLVTNRTLSPTQVAGFNQLFDDGFGDSSWRRGVALDWRIRHGLFAGAEASWRDLDHPFVDTELGEAVFVKHREQSHRVYAYWLAMPQLALSTQLVYDLFKAERSRLTVEGDVPERLRTVSVPLTARYFHETGFFAGFGATYVTQKVERSPDALLGLAEGSERFFVLDASLGYRLPFRRGIISLAVNNLLDRKFRFQDDSFRSFRDEPTIGPYIPSRAVVGRVTLNF